jgi:hypothetical protein
MGKHRRGSNSESGMRLLRRLEKNHDGIRSAATRQHYIQLYQAITYLSLDIAEFIEKGRDCSRATGFIQPVHDAVLQGFVPGLRLGPHATYPAPDAS